MLPPAQCPSPKQDPCGPQTFCPGLKTVTFAPLKLRKDDNDSETETRTELIAGRAHWVGADKFSGFNVYDVSGLRGCGLHRSDTSSIRNAVTLTASVTTRN